MPEMSDSDILFFLILGGLAIWVAYKVGKNVGRANEIEAQRLSRQADAETDPIKKQELLLKWNEVATDNSRVKRAFRKALRR